MSRAVFREELAGISLGIFFLTVFGFVWASLGTSSLPGSAVFLVVSAVVSFGLISSGFYLRRVARSLPEMPQNMMGRGIMKRFRTVFIIEGVAIAFAVLILPRIGYPEAIPSVVALIVGIHFFPLAPLFRMPVYHVTGALLCVVFASTIIAALLSDSESAWFVVPGIGSALVLWGTGIFLATSTIQRLQSQ